MSEPLRVCRVCGLEAFNEADLEKFAKRKKGKYGRDNLCKKCAAAKWRKKHPRKTDPPYFRKCRVCGLEAWTKVDLEKFVKSKNSRYGRLNLCKKCYSKKRRKDRDKNRKKILKMKKRWRDNNLQKVREMQVRYRNKHKNELRKKNKRKIRFNDKRVLLDVNPRINICSICNREYPKDLEVQTSIHHWYYNEKDVLQGSIELCYHCHASLPKTRWVEPCEGEICSIIKYDANLFEECPVCGEPNPIWNKRLHKEYLDKIPEKIKQNALLHLLADELFNTKQSKQLLKTITNRRKNNRF